jgi:methionyl-tRNA formyltransferase
MAELIGSAGGPPLPDYRGAGQYSFAILNDDREFGTTFHFMVPEVDAGAILGQRRFAIEPAWTVQDLYEKTGVAFH